MADYPVKIGKATVNITEGGGGTQLYKHIYTLTTGSFQQGMNSSCYFTIISSISTNSELNQLLANNETCLVNGGIRDSSGEGIGGTLLYAYNENGTIYIQTTSGIYSYSSLALVTSYDTVTPL